MTTPDQNPTVTLALPLAAINAILATLDGAPSVFRSITQTADLIEEIKRQAQGFLQANQAPQTGPQAALPEPTAAALEREPS